MTQHIVITGASSGFGSALAKSYAGKGVHLHLSGRNEERLKQVKVSCEKLGAHVDINTFDVTDKEAVIAWLNALADDNAIDIIFANAGISAGTAGGDESIEQMEGIINTNLLGVIYTIQPLLAYFKKRQHGQIVLISSMAGFRGLGSAPAYSVSKQAVKSYAEALRTDLLSYGVGVTVVHPGYIKTPMTDANNFPMPLMIEADKAAALVKKKLTSQPPTIVFPIMIFWIMWLLSNLPRRLTDRVVASFPKK